MIRLLVTTKGDQIDGKRAKGGGNVEKTMESYCFQFQTERRYLEGDVERKTSKKFGVIKRTTIEQADDSDVYCSNKWLRGDYNSISRGG